MVGPDALASASSSAALRTEGAGGVAGEGMGEVAKEAGKGLLGLLGQGLKAWNEYMMRGGTGGEGWMSVYLMAWKWNAMGWGNVAFV